MRKTKKEKLAASIHRQKEIARFKPNFTRQENNFDLTNGIDDRPIQFSLQNTANLIKPNKKEETLTNLSYLPKQLTKIFLITILLVVVQFILFFTIL